MHYSAHGNIEAFEIDTLDCLLDLQRDLVGVTFFRSESDYEQSPAEPLRKPLSYCSMVRMGTLGNSRKAKFEHICCPGAQRALGLSAPDEAFLSGKRYQSLGLYKEVGVAKKTAEQVFRMKEPVFGVCVQPLSACTIPPHVVICICNPNQAMRLVQGYIYSNGPSIPIQSLGMQGLCAELTVHPFQTGIPNVSLLCSNTRHSCSWGDGELGVGMPYTSFHGIVDGVLKTMNATESDKRKKTIAARSKEMQLTMDIRPGAAYYLSAVPKKNIPAPPPALSISTRNICKTHTLKSDARILAIKDVTIDVREGEFLTIVGPSGCGKSTLLSLLAGMAKPDSGNVSFLGRDSAQNLNLGYISQIDTLLPWRTVRGNVEVGLELRGVSKKERRETADKLMEQVGLSGFENSYPFELSGGMKKRAAVIRTMAYDPDIIFMDEPFVGLDVQTRDELEEDILNLWQKRRKTIVMVTHDLGEAITLSDRVILLTARPGSIKAEYDVPLPRPRSVVESKFSDEFIKLHKRIWRDLSAEVVKAAKDQANG